MNKILTVEDCNTVVYDNQDYYWYSIDTSNISSDVDYTEVPYDFCKITRQTVNGQRKYKYTIDIYDTNWTGGVIDYIEGAVSISYYDDKLIIEANSPTIQFELYMGLEKLSDSIKTRAKLVNDSISLNLEELSEAQTISYVLFGIIGSVSQIVNKGFNLIEYGVAGYNAGYLWVKLLKTDFQFDCNQSLVVGKVNKVQLGTSAKYKPNGALIGNNTPTIKVVYKDTVIPATWDNSLNDYCFNLDLTDKVNPSKIRFKVNVEPNEALNETSTVVVLDADYESISSYANLVNACNVGGASHIRLGANITLTNSIPVRHSIKIIGNDKTLNLNGKGFIIKEDVTFKAEKVSFNNGNTAIKQSKNSTVELTGCKFNHNTGFGSCIKCDIDYDSLSVEDDYTTILNDCLFTNNNTCIIHGGELTVNNCRYHNTDTTYIDKENVAFLYQMDGNATINNNIFDIDYDTNTLCSNEQSIGYAQALLQCGLTARINNATSTDLLQDNSLPFDRNACHVFAKYYYPQIEACVYTSPVLSKEDKAVCYAVTGENWIFKQNVQITRASWDSQNENRKIIWED